MFLEGGVILRDIRAGICGLLVGFRSCEGAVGVPDAVGTEIDGLCVTFAYPLESGAHASGRKGAIGCGWHGTHSFRTGAFARRNREGVGVRSYT